MRRLTACVTAFAMAMAAVVSGGQTSDGPAPDLFWIQHKKANPPAGAGQVEAAEKRLGVRLPATYVALMTRQNGGYTRYGGLKDPVTGRVRVYVLNESLLPLEQLRTLTDIAGDVDFGDTPDWTRFLKDARRWIVLSRHGNDWFLCFDYSSAGPKGEPAVVSLDTSDVPREEFRVGSFGAFRSRLVYDGAAAGTGHHYAIEAPPAEEKALVAALERSFSLKLASGPDPYSWFDLERSWTPPRGARPYFQLQPNRDRRGGLQLPERPQAPWHLRVVDLPAAQQAGFEAQLRKIPFPVKLVRAPPVAAE
jgi:hypothetical protein